MKKLLLIFLGLIFFIGISAQPYQKSYQRDSIQKQDSLKKVYLMKQKTKTTKMTDMERKKMEYLEWQKRSQQMDKNFNKMDQQDAMMDSLLNKKNIDTVKVKK